MYKQQRDENKKHQSKTKLTNACISKIKTTMVGAISDIEKHMGDIIKTDEGAQIFDLVRSSILDRGNNQIRALEQEIASYEVTFNQYTLKSVFLKKD